MVERLSETESTSFVSSPGKKQRFNLLILGGDEVVYKELAAALPASVPVQIKVIAPCIHTGFWLLADRFSYLLVQEKEAELQDLEGMDMVLPMEGTGNSRPLVTLASLLHRAQGRPRNSWFAKAAAWSYLDSETRWKRLASRFVWAFTLMIVGHVLIQWLPVPDWSLVSAALTPFWRWEVLLFVLAGFLAQMVDGALGMGYGMISAISLMTAGVSPVAMSAAIHTSEVFASGISGYSHYRFGNVNKKLFRHLVLPGVAGAVLGALTLVFLGEWNGDMLRILIAVYALFLGVRILSRVFRKKQGPRQVKRLGWLAGCGGFLDSFGGGGWGPIVTSTLIAKGKTPRYIIGSVSLTEFFITLASAATFIGTVGTRHLPVVVGLLIGGAIAAPIASRLAGKLPAKKMLLAVGILVVLWSMRILITAIW